jgi:hypothetical protein
MNSAWNWHPYEPKVPPPFQWENTEMATLVLDKVPDELLSQLEKTAAQEQVSVAEKTVRLL